MKLLYTILSASTLGFTAIASAEKTCKLNQKHCALTTAKTEKCSKQKCDTECDEDSLTNLVVTGMTCGKCSTKLKASLAKIEGVTVKKVCLKSGNVAVKINADKANAAKVHAAIADTGFKVAGEKLNIPVTGMTCGACTKKVSTALTSLEGCSVNSVCHKSGHASVTIDTAKTSKEKVIKAITNSGFKVTTAKKSAPVKG